MFEIYVLWKVKIEKILSVCFFLEKVKKMNMNLCLNESHFKLF